MSKVELLDLSPARWIWFPSQRTLANTFVLFRKEINLERVPKSALGWITADSRYKLTVNGHRVQWGPAPFDPRHAEADPVDLSNVLREGRNVIGIEVLYYGYGDGTTPFGKPGLLFRLDIDGQIIGTDAGWKCVVDRAHRPGQYQRWYLRALQEVFDAREHPEGWDLAGFDASLWRDAKVLSVPPTRAAFSGGYSAYSQETFYIHPNDSTLIKRTIPLLTESDVVAKLTHNHHVRWLSNIDDWFEFRAPNCFEITPAELSHSVGTTPTALTYELEEEVVGWPFFEIEASEGTVVELMTQECHDPMMHPWMDSHLYCWSRFVCKEGRNRFEAFDFEALKWIQLHIHENKTPVEVSQVGVRRRSYAWPNKANLKCSDPSLQRLFDATLNTLDNSAQETCVDGMGRERQQYSGDGGHQLNAVRLAFGENRLPERFIRTFGYGQMIDGVFADSWPAVDRLQRLWQRNVDASDWGPIIDHSIGFCFDCYRHWLHTADLEAIQLVWARLIRFADYLESVYRPDGLIPVEGVGVNAVWIDHYAFERQSHKRLALNLYAAAMLQHALAPLAEEIEPIQAGKLRRFGQELEKHAMKAYWDPKEKTLVNNRPFGEKSPRFDDRSLSTAILFDMLPDPRRSVQLLADPTDQVGISYPCNAVWRYWALAKSGKMQTVLDEFRKRWATMRSVIENNSLQEYWTLTSDTTAIASHCPVSPAILAFDGLMGVSPLKAGFREIELRPQCGDLESVILTAFTVLGPINFSATKTEYSYQIPSGVEKVRIYGEGVTTVPSSGRLTLKR